MLEGLIGDDGDGIDTGRHEKQACLEICTVGYRKVDRLSLFVTEINGAGHVISDRNGFTCLRVITETGIKGDIPETTVEFVGDEPVGARLSRIGTSEIPSTNVVVDAIGVSGADSFSV